MPNSFLLRLHHGLKSPGVHFVTLVAIFLTALIIAPTTVGAQSNCAEVFRDKRSELPFETRTVNLEDFNLQYSQVAGKNLYDVTLELPSLKEAFLIHIDPNGHVMLWYRNLRIDSEGDPLISVHGKKRDAHFLTSGVVFAIHHLPEGFDEKLKQFLSGYEGRASLTCSTIACSSLSQLGLLPSNSKKYVSPLGFFRHLTQLSAQPENDVEVWSLGQDMNNFTRKIKIGQIHLVLGKTLGNLLVGDPNDL
jgi:hypothetical protein